MIPLPFTLLSWVRVYTPFFVFPVQRISFSICLTYCNAPMLGAYIFIISSWIDPLIIMQCPSLSFFTAFVLKSILSGMSIATPAFFWSLFVWNFFPALHFQSACVPCFEVGLLQTTYIGVLLVGAFNPFTFKVIIDKYDPVAIYFIVLGLSLYTLSVFPVQRISFSIYWRAGLVVLNSLSFCLSVKLLISPSYVNEILAGYSNLGCAFFSFITLSVSCHSFLA